MLHIISRHRYPLALSILLTCASFSICCQRGWAFGNEDIDNDGDMDMDMDMDTSERTCISRASASCSRVVLLSLSLPLILVDVVAVATSCTQLEAINFRPDKAGKDEETRKTGK